MTHHTNQSTDSSTTDNYQSTAISVIVPAYNADQWIVGTVESCLSIPAIDQIIVVDDGSTTPASETLNTLLNTHSHLVVIPNAGKGGQEARNTGIEYALKNSSANWFGMLDHDDEFTANITDAIGLGNSLNAVLILPDREHFDDEGFREVVSRRNIPARTPIPPAMVHNATPVWTATGLLVHRSALEKGIRFNPKFTCADDHDFIRQAAQHGPIAFQDSVGLRRRLFPDGRNLSGPRTLVPRVHDYLMLYDTWFDQQDAEHWEPSWRWFLNQLVKNTNERVLIKQLMKMGTKHGWSIPAKIKLRVLKSKLLPR